MFFKKPMIRLFAVISTTALSIFSSTLVLADKATSVPFNITANVKNQCLVPTSADLPFGTYDPSSSNPLTKTVANSIQVSCTKNTAANLTLSTSQNGAAPSGGNSKSMIGAGGAKLGYDILTPVDGSNCNNNTWTTGNVPVTGQGITTPVKLALCGQINKNQDVPAGNYADTLTVTIEFTP